MKKEYHLTKQGIEELKTELAELKSLRGDVAEKLKTARGFGDLSENAEYDAARAEQNRVESRISEIEHILLNADEIKTSKKGYDKVELGCTVELSDGDTLTFTVVGSVEANPMENKVSDESPIGKAILGKKIGDEVEIESPKGSKTYTIKTIK